MFPCDDSFQSNSSSKYRNLRCVHRSYLIPSASGSVVSVPFSRAPTARRKHLRGRGTPACRVRAVKQRHPIGALGQKPPRAAQISDTRPCLSKPEFCGSPEEGPRDNANKRPTTLPDCADGSPFRNSACGAERAAGTPAPDVPYVPTTEEAVQAMLKLRRQENRCRIRSWLRRWTYRYRCCQDLRRARCGYRHKS